MARLGSSPKEHAKKARARAEAASRHAKLARAGSCGIRFTSLEAAISNIGKAFAQAFDSGGRVAKGALSPKTVSTADAKRVYDVDNEVSEAVSAFRRDCLKNGEALEGRKRRRR